MGEKKDTALAIRLNGFQEENLDLTSRAYTRSQIIRLCVKMIHMFEVVTHLIWTKDQAEIVIRIANDLKTLTESTQEGWGMDQTKKHSRRLLKSKGRKG